MNAPADIDAALDEALRHAPAAPGVDVEISIIDAESRTVAWADGKPNLNNAAGTRGACVRALAEGGQGIATTTVPEPEAIASIAERAIAAAREMPKDPHRRLADPDGAAPPSIPWDDSLFRQPADEILAGLAAIEASVLAIDPKLKKVVRLSWSERRQARAVGNSRGVRRSDVSTSASCSVELLAVDGSVTEAAWDYRASRFRGSLRPAEMVTAIAHDALRSLGGRAIPTGAYPLVLSPRVGAQLLGLLGEALSAEAVQKERSFLKGLLGKPVAAPFFTLHDDPFLADGVASEAFDDEGTTRRALTPIAGGVLADYFYDLRSAARAGRDSNGRGSKANLASPPRPAPTNLFVAPGTTPVETMLASDQKVFLLREVMGLHMADPITGEFSLGGSGYLYEKGKFAAAVRGVTIAGTVGGMVGGVTAIGPDLTWYGSIGSPSLLVTGLTVAGS